MAAHYEQSRHRAWCVERGHPGATYNPLLDRTWCACGEVIVDGDTATHELCCAHLTPGLTSSVAAAIAQAVA